ncbi:MAG TPA: YcxB family protein [Candidatus Obscuribacter sp.]|nr:YcxB family protein [Candidatus Obscuribacter sp.]
MSTFKITTLPSREEVNEAHWRYRLEKELALSGLQTIVGVVAFSLILFIPAGGMTASFLQGLHLPTALCVVVGFFVGGTVLVGPILLARSFLTAEREDTLFDSNAIYSSPITYEIQENGILVRALNLTRFLEWSEIAGGFDIPEVLFFLDNTQVLYPIPKRSFVDWDQERAVRTKIRESIKEFSYLKGKKVEIIYEGEAPEPSKDVDLDVPKAGIQSTDDIIEVSCSYTLAELLKLERYFVFWLLLPLTLVCAVVLDFLLPTVSSMLPAPFCNMVDPSFGAPGLVLFVIVGMIVLYFQRVKQLKLLYRDDYRQVIVFDNDGITIKTSKLTQVVPWKSLSFRFENTENHIFVVDGRIYAIPKHQLPDDQSRTQLLRILQTRIPARIPWYHLPV